MAEQEIKSFDWLEDIQLEPETLRRVYTSDFFQRTLAHNYVFDGKLWRPMRGTDKGEVVVVPREEAIDGVRSYVYSNDELPEGPLNFYIAEGVESARKVRVVNADGELTIVFYVSGGYVAGPIVVEPFTSVVFDLPVKGLNLLNSDIAGVRYPARGNDTLSVFDDDFHPIKFYWLDMYHFMYPDTEGYKIVFTRKVYADIEVSFTVHNPSNQLNNFEICFKVNDIIRQGLTWSLDPNETSTVYGYFTGILKEGDVMQIGVREANPLTVLSSDDSYVRFSSWGAVCIELYYTRPSIVSG